MSNILSFDENDANWRRMGRAIRYLSAHYLDQPSLEDAATAVNLSPFHFQRLFTRYVGVSPKNFVGHLTLDHAKSDLAQGKNLLETSLDAGLSGPSRLHDLCLKIEAMTPGDYAKGGAGDDDSNIAHDESLIAKFIRRNGSNDRRHMPRSPGQTRAPSGSASMRRPAAASSDRTAIPAPP